MLESDNWHGEKYMGVKGGVVLSNRRIREGVIKKLIFE